MEENRVVQKDEIDLLELIKIIWSRRWFIFKIASVFIAIGLVISFTSPKEYSTYCTLIPEMMNSEAKLGGSLGGLASLAGIDLGGMSPGSSTINPGLYQSVARSTPFLLSILDQRYFFSEQQKELSIREYYDQHYKSSLFSKMLSFPWTVIGWFRSSEKTEITDGTNKNFISLTKDEKSILENLRDRVLVTLDYDLSVVIVEVEMQDPLVAAQLAEFTQNYITNYVTAYTISKSNQQLEFIENQYSERKNEFLRAQLNLAKFRDSNRNINTAQAQSEEERLQSEYNLSFNVYNQLAQQRETIKLQLNENTPVFTVLEPPIIPIKPTKPNKILLLTLFSLTGGLVGSGIIFIRLFL